MNAGQAKENVQAALGVPVDGDLGPITRARFNLLAATPNTGSWPPGEDAAGELVATIAGVKVYRGNGVIYWTSKAAVDVDGAPDAYHRDDRKGRDYLANAGHPGDWWGIVTDTDHLPGQVGKGKPLVQGDTAPEFSEATRGFYVSQTALADNPELPISDVRRYCNPDEVPGIVLPLKFPIKVRMGAPCRVSYQGRTASGVVFDAGPPASIGELGTLMAKLLGIPDSPKSGGVAGGVRFEIPVS